jgi:hypothetical protein
MHVVFIRYCSALLMKRLKATQRRYARTPRRSAAPQALCSNEAGASGAHARNFASAADASVRLLLPRHRSARCQRNKPATALDRRWVWAPRRRFTHPRAWIVSGDENLAIKEWFRTDLA